MNEHQAVALPEALYRAEQVRELDRRAIQNRGIPGYTLMSRAGAAVLSALRRRWPGARRLVVACGGGNNAGDGYVVARLALQAGMEVRVLYLVAPERLRGDAATAHAAAVEAGVAIAPFAPQALGEAEVVVDAILGTGLEREVQGAWRDAIEAVDAHAGGVIAVDIPSGLHADSGAILGAAIHADLTVSFIGLKQGLFSGEGPACTGAVRFDDLQVPADVYTGMTPSALAYAGADLPRLLPPRSPTAHKGHHGHVLVVGGDTGMAGAARMAAEAAARTGAGLVSVATRAAHAALCAVSRPELMAHGVETPEDLAPLLERATVIAVGPGLGQDAWGEAMLAAALASGRPLVVDADGLNLLARKPLRSGRWVLTPHPGEAARLLGVDTARVQADRYGAAADIAQSYDGVVVLKGAGTLVAATGATTRVCLCGNPGMGSGGLGDVLTGVIASLLAQGLDAGTAARAGVFLHGRAADLAAAAAGERGLMALDLMPHLRALVNPGAGG